MSLSRLKICILLAFLLFLPSPELFAYEHTFDLIVKDFDGEPVENAEVIAWDLISSYYYSAQRYYTDASGSVEIAFYSLQEPYDKTNFDPNIGLFIVPPQDHPKELAFVEGHAKLWTPFDSSLSKPVEITLQQGKKITFDLLLEYFDDDNELQKKYGIANSLNVSIGSLPFYVLDKVSCFNFGLYDFEHTADNPFYLVLPTDGTRITIRLGDDDMFKVDKPYYYDTLEDSFSAELAENDVVELIHSPLPKGRLIVETPGIDYKLNPKKSKLMLDYELSDIKASNFFVYFEDYYNEHNMGRVTSEAMFELTAEGHTFVLRPDPNHPHIASSTSFAKEMVWKIFDEDYPDLNLEEISLKGLNSMTLLKDEDEEGTTTFPTTYNLYFEDYSGNYWHTTSAHVDNSLIKREVSYEYYRPNQYGYSIYKGSAYIPDGKKEIYLPYGKYDFKFSLGDKNSPYLDKEGFSPAVALWPDEYISEDPLIKEYNPSGGTGLDVNITLAEGEGSSDLLLVQSFELELYKYEPEAQDTNNGWLEVQTVNIGEALVIATGTVNLKFPHRVEEGAYKLNIRDGSARHRGIIDPSANPPVCYSFPVLEEFEVGLSPRMSKEIDLPQAPGLFVVVEGTNLSEYKLEDLRVGIIPATPKSPIQPSEVSSNYLVPITTIYGSYGNYGTYGVSGTSVGVFVPFLNNNEGIHWGWSSNTDFVLDNLKLVIRATLSHKTDSDLIPAFHKVFEPIALHATPETQLVELEIDETNFVFYSGEVYLGEEPYVGPANILISPIIPTPDSDLSLYGHEVFNSGQYREDERGFDKDGLSDSSDFCFALEKGIDHLVRVVPHDNLSPIPLDAIGEYRKIVNIEENETDVIFDIQTDSGKLDVYITHMGEEFPEDSVVTIGLISHDEYNKDRFGTITSSRFQLGALKTGRYSLTVDVDNFSFDSGSGDLADRLFTMQSMPIVSRSFYYNADNPLEELRINLDPNEMGYVSGRLVDDKKEPVAGVRLAVVPASVYGMSEYWNLDTILFFMHTDEDGRFVRNTEDAANYIPLEPGKYKIFACGMLDHGTGFENLKYAVGEENAFLNLTGENGFEIRLAQGVNLPDIELEKIAQINAKLRVDGQPLPWVSLAFVSLTNPERSYRYDIGEDSHVNLGLPADEYLLALEQDAWEDNSSFTRVFLQRFEVTAEDCDSEKPINKEIELKTAGLARLKIEHLHKNSEELSDVYLAGNLFFRRKDGNYTSNSHALDTLGFYLNSDYGSKVMRAHITKLSDVGFSDDYEYVFEGTSYDHMNRLFPVENVLAIPEEDLSHGVTLTYKYYWHEGFEIKFALNEDTYNPDKQYLAILVEESDFFGWGAMRHQGHEPHYPLDGEYAGVGLGYLNYESPYAWLDDGVFEFKNLPPRYRYKLVIYESDKLISEEELENLYYSYQSFVPSEATLLWRHLEDNIVSQDAEIEISLRNTAYLTIQAKPEKFLTRADQFIAKFTENPDFSYKAMTAWPAFYLNESTLAKAGLIATLTYELPVNYPLRLEFKPDVYEQPLVEENILIKDNGRLYTFRVSEPITVSGTFYLDGVPSRGNVFFIPPTNLDTGDNGYQVNSNSDGTFNIQLPAAEYYVGIEETDEYPMHIHGLVRVNSLLAVDNLEIKATSGVEVKGKILDSKGEPLTYAGVAVMRKINDRSSLYDGAELFPYAGVVAYADRSGEVSFLVQKNVDYYLIPFDGETEKQGKTIKVSVGDETPEPFAAVIEEGLKVVGTVNVAATILFEEPAANSAFKVLAHLQNDDGMYDFAAYGLSEDAIYDLTVFPNEPGYAVKKITNLVFGKIATASFDIELSEATELEGRLLDLKGQPLEIADVELEMIVLMLSANQNEQSSGKLSETVLSVRTNYEGRYSFGNIPETIVSAEIQTNAGFVHNGIAYAAATTGRFKLELGENITKNLTVSAAGKIVGRLLDSDGTYLKARVEIESDSSRFETNSGDDGRFEFDHLPPAASYRISSITQSGKSLFLASNPAITLRSGQIADFGNIIISDMVTSKGKLEGISSLINRDFPNGRTSQADLAVLAFDASYLLKDEEMINIAIESRIKGVAKPYWDIATAPEELPFTITSKPGAKNFVALALSYKAKDMHSIVVLGSQKDVRIPQLELTQDGTYDFTARPIEIAQEFAKISGTVKHQSDESFVLDAQDSAIAFYEVDKNNTLLPTFIPAAIVLPENNNWVIDTMPLGRYRAKVITKKHGIHLLPDLIEVTEASENETFELTIGGALKQYSIMGQVCQDLNGELEPVSGAAVSMILANLRTLTDENGEFEFFVPENEFVYLQLELKNYGYLTQRIATFPGAVPEVASSGLKVTENINLGVFVIAPAEGIAEIQVLDEDGEPVFGTEVAMVLEQASEDSIIYTVADRKVTDRSGLVRFAGVPLNTEVSFRAKAHFYAPKTIVVTGDMELEETIELALAPPRVFFTGFPERIEGNDTELKLRATFDFNRVVEKDRIGLKTLIKKDGEDLDVLDVESSDLSYPDIIGNRLTNMVFDGKIRNVDDLYAVVEYEKTGEVGEFDRIGDFQLVGRAIFRKEFEVDPLAEEGFTGRASDEKGNLLPVGLYTPPGFVPPEIDSFELQINEKPEDVEVKLDDSSLVVEHAGPTFNFTFNQGSHHAASTQMKGLFEITLQYDSTDKNLEPRWKDDKGNWSKVGIISDSVKWDTPSEGYVTFIVDHLTEFGVFAGFASEDEIPSLRGDLTGDGKVGLEDIAVYLAYYMSGSQKDLEKLTPKAQELYKSDYEAKCLPSSVDDFNADGSCNLSDVAVMLAWYMTGKNPDTGVLTTKAKDLFAAFQGTVEAIPGEEINR